MSCPRSENHDPSFLQVPEGTATDKRLSHVFHLDGGENPSLHPGIFQRILQGERVDHGGQHSHIVGGVPIHLTFIGRRSAPPNVATSNHNAELEMRRKNPFNLLSETLNDGMGKVVGGVAQGFPRKF